MVGEIVIKQLNSNPLEVFTALMCRSSTTKKVRVNPLKPRVKNPYLKEAEILKPKPNYQGFRLLFKKSVFPLM